MLVQTVRPPPKVSTEFECQRTPPYRGRERKSVSKARKQVESRVAKAEADILKLETEQAELSKQLENPSAYTASEAAKDFNIKAAHIVKYLEKKNNEWDLATEELSKPY